MLLHFVVLHYDGYYRPVCGKSGWGYHKNEGDTGDTHRTTCPECKETEIYKKKASVV